MALDRLEQLFSADAGRKVYRPVQGKQIESVTVGMVSISPNADEERLIAMKSPPLKPPLDVRRGSVLHWVVYVIRLSGKPVDGIAH